MKKQLLSVTVLFIISVFCRTLAQTATPTLWGMTYLGGTAGNGTIFRITTGGPNFNSNYSFTGKPDGENSYGGLITGTNGLLYGMTQDGGAHNSGTIFSYDISSGIETDLYNFGSGTDGQFPEGSLVQVGDTLYGMTSDGGMHGGSGIIFGYNIVNGGYSVLHYFGSDTDGANPQFSSLLQASNGLLYGLTAGGGGGGSGTLFSYDITSGVEADLHSFVYPDGKNPNGSLIEVNDSLLYGMTKVGGTNNLGIIFKFNTTTNKETILYDFNSYPDAESPIGDFLQVNDSLLFAIAGGDGYYNKGVIFKFNITNNKETILHSFGNSNDGQDPTGSLMLASDGLLYGMTTYGGTTDSGTIFSYNISQDTELVIHNFTGPDGERPAAGGYLLENDDTVTGINQLSFDREQLTIYPNPTSSQFTVKLNGNQNGYTLEIYNVLGEKIYQSVLKNPQTVIDIGTQSAGIYFVYLKSEAGIETGKVLITK